MSRISKLKINDIDIISYGNDPFLQIREKYLKLAIKNDYRIKALIDDSKRIDKLFNTEKLIRNKLGFKKIEFNNHHLCHLASTFYPSGFKRSLVISYDGIGEINSALFGVGNKKSIKIIHDKNKYPDSLGLFYTAITFYLGWRIYCDEGIIMGLAPYGDSSTKVPKKKKRYIDYFREIIKIDKKDPLKYLINLDWISYHYQRDTWLSQNSLTFW